MTSIIDSADLKQGFGSFATGVTVVTARSANGQPVAMTVSSFSGVSLDPPLVMWCAQRGVWPFEVFEACSHYAVHVLHAGQADLAMHCARDIDDKFDGMAHHEGWHGLPILDDYAALFQCRVERRIDAGDHLVLLGRVEALDCRTAEALVFHAGRLGTFQAQ